MVPRNSTPGVFAYIWQSKCVGIIAIKTERTQIHFFSDVLVAVASSNLKVPIKQQRRRTKATKTSLKKWICATSNFIPLIPTRSICQMMANFSGVEFLKTVSKFRKRSRESLSRVHVLDTTWNCSRAAKARKCTKERCTCKVVYIYNPFQCSSSLSIRVSFCELTVLFITSFKSFEWLFLWFTPVWWQFSLFKFW